MKKHLFKNMIAAFIAIVLLLVTSFTLPCLSVQAAESTPEYWGLFIGVSNYQYLHALPFSDDDARELYESLSPVWGTSHTKLLLNSQAKKADILAAITWLANSAGPEDTVLFNYSGYGSYIGVFHPYDSSGATSVNAISPDELASAFTSVKAGKIIFILNCGAAGIFQDALAGSGRVIIMSSASTENTYSITFLQHSVFIYYLLEAFAKFSTVDSNHDYELSAEEIFAYASPLTTEYEQENQQYFPIIQHPIINDGYSGEFPLLAKFVFSIDTQLPSGTTILTLDSANFTSTFAPLFWVPGVSHTMTVPQTVTVNSGTRYAFVGWNDAETSNIRVISSGSFTARYNKEYLLTINSAYSSSAGAGWYEDGATANFSITSPVITSNSKHYFTGWSGNYIGTLSNGSIVMNTPQTITANWRTENLLTINSEYGEPVGAGWYDEGESVNISIEPIQGFIIRHFFTGWSGDLIDVAANSVVTMTSPKVITANWETDYLQLYILIIILLVVGGAGAVLVIYLYRLKKRKVKKS
jgi:hypothetical protein